MKEFEALNYNNQKWAVVGTDGTTLFEGDYVSCRRKAFELFQNGVAIKRLNMYDRYDDVYDITSWETVKSELDSIEKVKKIQREQPVDEVKLTSDEKRQYEGLAKRVREGRNKVFTQWHELYDIEEETFVKQVKWLYADPCIDGSIPTRAIGIEPDGTFKRLAIVRNWGGTYFRDEENGRAWKGQHITWITIDR